MSLLERAYPPLPTWLRYSDPKAQHALSQASRPFTTAGEEVIFQFHKICNITQNLIYKSPTPTLKVTEEYVRAQESEHSEASCSPVRGLFTRSALGCSPGTWIWEGSHHAQKRQEWLTVSTWSAHTTFYAGHLLSFWESGGWACARQGMPTWWVPSKNSGC